MLSERHKLISKNQNDNSYKKEFVYINIKFILITIIHIYKCNVKNIIE